MSPEKSTIGRSKEDVAIHVTPGMAMIGVFVRTVDRVSPSLGARLAARMFLTPRRPRIPSRELEWLSRATPETFPLERFTLQGHRWSRGGKPVLLVHGWEGRGSQLGGLALAIAARGFQPVTVDLPAHGATRGAQTNLLEFAEAIRQMTMRIGPVAGIVAHSFGAAGTTVAMRDKLAVDRFVYLAPSEDFDHFPNVFGRAFGLPADLRGRMQRTIEHRLGATMADLRGATIAPRMKQPLLVVHDEDDADVPLRDGRVYAKAWPDARLLTTSGLGHRRILRDGKVLDAVAGFLAGEFIRTKAPSIARAS